MIKLNLGCGNYHLDGYINIDKDPNVSPNEIIDLGYSILPYKNKTVDYVFSNHITKDETDFLLKELHRVLKDDSIIDICVPHYLNPVAYQCLHKQRYSEQYFIGNDLFDFIYKLSFRRYKFSIVPCNIFFTLRKKEG